MHLLRTWLRPAALAAAVVSAASCADSAAVTAPPVDAAAASLSPTLIECPSDATVSATATVGATGGVVNVAGHELRIPALAVATPTAFTVTVPASQYMRVDVHADGHGSYQFRKPVSLTLSYARCTRQNIGKEALRIFYVDSATQTILQDMGGVDDPSSQTVTTDTDHLSGYVIGQG